jgi:drug/metabolite transporter (DMT)-like permease
MDQKQITPSGLANLIVVYLVWGSTYLAIRVGIRSGSGFGPYWFGGLRVITAGILLLSLGLVRKKRLFATWKELGLLMASGLLLWIGGNGLVILAEQRVASGLAALIVASTPIWVALYEALLDKKAPSPYLILALVIGFSGIAILSIPVLTSGIRADVLSVLALLLASLSWSAGLTLQSRHHFQLGKGVSSGFQQLFGGLFFLLIALIAGEGFPTPTPQAWLAWGYLVVFGSLIAFTSFVSALQQLPASLVTSYAYVNPVIAVILGWLILKEPITVWTIAGGMLVLVGVTGIFRYNQASSRKKPNSG